MFGSTFFQLNRTRIIALAAQHRLPAIYGCRHECAEEGGLMAYAAWAPNQLTCQWGKLTRSSSSSTSEPPKPRA